MSVDWPIVPLGEYCLKVGSGATPRGGSNVYLDEGPTSLIRSQNIYNEGFKEEGIAYIDDEAADKLKNVIVEANDVLLNITGDSVARSCLALREHLPARVNQHVAIIRPDPKEFDPRYIRYFLVSPNTQSYLLTLAGSGGTRNALTKGMIESLDIPKPDIYIQNRLADILSLLDDKILLNHQINQTLEQIAQAIFKSWFVDFEPVKAKIAAKENGQDPERAAMCAISGKNDVELNHLPADQLSQLATTATLFPDELVDSELGMMPNGWQVLKSSELCDVRDGTHDSPKQSPKGKYLITSKHITGGTIDHSKAYLISETDFKQVNQRSKVDSYDILLTMIGTVGVPLLVLEDTIDFAIKNIGLFKVGRNKQLAVFFFLYLKTTLITQFLESRVAGTTQKYLTLKILRSIPVLTPSDEIIKCFGDNALQTFKKIHENNTQNNNLTQLRDTLLPKLLSGEISVADTQAKIEAAV